MCLFIDIKPQVMPLKFQWDLMFFSHLTMLCSKRLYFICACSKRRESSPTSTVSSSVGLTAGWSSPWRTSAGWRRRRSESWRRWEWHLHRIMVWSMNIFLSCICSHPSLADLLIPSSPDHETLFFPLFFFFSFFWSIYEWFLKVKGFISVPLVSEYGIAII